MIQTRSSAKTDSRRTDEHQQTRPKGNAVWKQAESRPNSCPGQISSLTTVSIVKDFLLRQGMDSESWKFTNVKNMYLPSVRTNGLRQDNACLRAVSVPLKPRKKSEQSSSIRDEVVNPKEERRRRNDTRMSNTSKCNETIRVVPHGTDGIATLKVKKREPGVWQASHKREELFTIPTSSKNYLPLVNTNITSSEIANRSVAPELLSVNEASVANARSNEPSVANARSNEASVANARSNEASVAKIFDFIDEKYFLERSRTHVNASSRDNSAESKQEACIHDLKESMEGSNSDTAEEECEGRGRVRRSTARCERSKSKSQQQKHEISSIQDGDDRKPVDRCDTVEIKESRISDFEEKVERFNEASSLIRGFNQRYPKVRMSLKYLVNHLNHKKMVKKFYGVVDSRRLNESFTPVNILHTGGTTMKKREILQNRRIRWLTAATDALEVDANGVIARLDRNEDD